MTRHMTMNISTHGARASTNSPTCTVQSESTQISMHYKHFIIEVHCFLYY
jgi:hypothetical protein